VNWIPFLVGAGMVLGLSRRLLGGSTRMTLLVVVVVAIVGLYVTDLR